MCFAPHWRALFRDLNFQKWSEPLVFLTFWLPNVLRATLACTVSRSELPKVVRTPSVFNILTSKCASRHNGVHFFEIWTSKSGPRMVCFVHFDLEMCFALQRRALFRYRNFQKWSDAEVFCTFWLGNVLRATTARTFSTSQLVKMVRSWCVLYILTSKCASRHNGVQFFISHLASWLCTRRFSEPTFRPSGAPNHWKNTVFRDFPTFSRICIFFLLTLSLLLFFLLIFLFSLPLPCSAFHLSILSEVWLLNFLRIRPFGIYHVVKDRQPIVAEQDRRIIHQKMNTRSRNCKSRTVFPNCWYRIRDAKNRSALENPFYVHAQEVDDEVRPITGEWPLV